MPGVERKLGQRVAFYRKLAEMTQEQLAEQVGVAPETISRLERGLAIPSIARLDELAGALGVGLVDLVQVEGRETARSRALDRLVALLRRRSAADIEVVHDMAARMFQRWK